MAENDKPIEVVLRESTWAEKTDLLTEATNVMAKKSIPGLTIALKSMGTALTEGLSQSNEAQKAALRIGMQVDEVVGKFPGQMNTAMGGFAANIKTTMQQLDIGMKNLGKHTSVAATRTRVLGGNTEGMIRAQRRMETHLAMDSASVDQASKNMVLLSQQFGISTDRLVVGLDLLSENLGTFAALNIGKDMTNAVTEFTAVMGAGNEALVAQFTKSLTELGGQSLSQAVIGGVEDIQREIMSGNVTANNLREAALRQGTRMQDMVSTMQAQGVNMTVALSHLERLYGKGAIAALQLSKQAEMMTDKQLKQIEIAKDWNNTIETLQDEILTPIKVSISKNLPAILKIFKGLMPVMQGILVGVTALAGARMGLQGIGKILGGGPGGRGMGRVGKGVLGGSLGIAGVAAMGGATGGLSTGAMAISGLTLLPLVKDLFFGKHGVTAGIEALSGKGMTAGAAKSGAGVGAMKLLGKGAAFLGPWGLALGGALTAGVVIHRKWKKRQEAAAALNEERRREEIHEANKSKIREETELFRKKYNKSFLSLTSEQLKKSMQQSIFGTSESSEVVALLGKLVAVTKQGQANTPASPLQIGSIP